MASQQKLPRKGILKTSSSFDQAEYNRQKEMKWDEMNIIATHHPPDKDYGHMKIDEPPTPYSKYSDQEDEEGEEGSARKRSVGDELMVDPETLESRLLGLDESPADNVKPRLRRVSTTDESSDDDTEETEEEKAKKKMFEQKRKLHYNEFQAVKLAKQLMEEEEDDEDEKDQVQPEGELKPGLDETSLDVETEKNTFLNARASPSSTHNQTTAIPISEGETLIE